MKRDEAMARPLRLEAALKRLSVGNSFFPARSCAWPDIMILSAKSLVDERTTNSSPLSFSRHAGARERLVPCAPHFFVVREERPSH